MICGSALQGKVVVVDDVITAGKAIGESFQIIQDSNATLSGVLVALDRQEKGKDTPLSAIQQIEATHKIKVCSIINLDDILLYLRDSGNVSHFGEIEKYREQWGV